MKSKYYESYEYDINHSEVGILIQKDYTILEELYRSDQSVLNVIQHKLTKETKVLKAIEKRNGFVFEVENALNIKSPWINAIHESYESESYIYLIVAYVDGMNLEQHIKTNGVMDESEAKRVIMMIANALGDLHNHKDSKYVFRDLKPSNIMMKPDGDIVLIDVITIREVKENKTQDTFLIGSKGYTAPEAYGFMQTTETSDIYSLGATLFYMLTGLQPGNITSFKSHLADKKDIKRYMKHIIYKATEFKPEDRFKNVNEFIQAMVRKKVGFSDGYKRVATILIISAFTLTLYNFVYLPSQVDGKAAGEYAITDDIMPESIPADLTSAEGKPKKLDQENAIELKEPINLWPLTFEAYRANSMEASVIGYKSNSSGDVELMGTTQTTAEEDSVSSSEIIGESNDLKSEVGSKSTEISQVTQTTPTTKTPVTSTTQKDNSFSIEDIKSAKDINVEELVMIKSGITFDLERANSLNIKVDRDKLPESVKDFAFMSVSTSNGSFQSSLTRQMVYEALIYGYGYQYYRSYGFSTNPLENTSAFIVFYALDNRPLAYYINNDFRSGIKESTAVVQPEFEIYNVADGIYFECFANMAVLHIDKTKVPNFTKLSIQGTTNSLSDFTDESWIEISEAGTGTQVYNSSGNSTGYGTSGTFKGNNWVILLQEDNNKVVKMYKVGN